MIAIVILRPPLVPLLEAIHLTFLKDAKVLEGNSEESPNRLAHLVKESLRWKRHVGNWCFHGSRVGGEGPVLWDLPDGDQIDNSRSLNYVERLAKAYSWCIIPWGVQGTGQMLLCLSSEKAMFDKIIGWLQLNAGNADLLVSSYTAEQIAEKSFRGALFHSSSEYRGQGLWESGAVSSEGLLALSYLSEETLRNPPEGAEVVCEAQGYQLGNRIRRRWVRVLNEHALMYYVNNPTTTIMASTDIDKHLQWLAIEDFASVGQKVASDPLQFALKALHSCSWVYVPAGDDENWEIYINRNPSVTKHLLSRNTKEPDRHFIYRSFC